MVSYFSQEQGLDSDTRDRIVRPSVLSFAVANQIKHFESWYTKQPFLNKSQSSFWVLNNNKNIALPKIQCHDTDYKLRALALGIVERMFFSEDDKQSYALVFIFAHDLDEQFHSLLKDHYKYFETFVKHHNIEFSCQSEHCYPAIVPWYDEFNNLAKEESIFSTDKQSHVLLLDLGLMPKAPYIKLQSIYPFGNTKYLSVVNTQANHSNALANYEKYEAQERNQGENQDNNSQSYDNLSIEQENGSHESLSQINEVFSGLAHFDIGLYLLINAHCHYSNDIVIEFLEDRGSNDTALVTIKPSFTKKLKPVFAYLLLQDDLTLFSTMYYMLLSLFEDNSDIDNSTLSKLSELESILHNIAQDITINKLYQKARHSFSSFIGLSLVTKANDMGHGDGNAIDNGMGSYQDHEQNDENGSVIEGDELCEAIISYNEKKLNNDSLLAKNITALRQVMALSNLGEFNNKALIDSPLSTQKVYAAQNYGFELKELLSTKLSFEKFSETCDNSNHKEARSDYLDLCTSSHLLDLETSLNEAKDNQSGKLNTGRLFNLESLLVLERYQSTVVRAITPCSFGYQNIAPLFFTLLNAGYNMQAMALHYLAHLMMSDYIAYNQNTKAKIETIEYTSLLSILFNKDESRVSQDFLIDLATSIYPNISIYKNLVLNSFKYLPFTQEQNLNCEQFFGNSELTDITTIDKSSYFVGHPDTYPVNYRLANSGILTLLLSKIKDFDALKLPYSLQCRFFWPLVTKSSFCAPVIYKYLEHAIELNKEEENSNLIYELALLWLIATLKQDNESNSCLKYDESLILAKLEHLGINKDSLTCGLTKLCQNNLIALFGLMQALELFLKQDNPWSELFASILKKMLLDMKPIAPNTTFNSYLMLFALYIKLNSCSTLKSYLAILQSFKCTNQESFMLVKKFHELSFLNLCPDLQKFLEDLELDESGSDATDLVTILLEHYGLPHYHFGETKFNFRKLWLLPYKLQNNLNSINQANYAIYNCVISFATSNTELLFKGFKQFSITKKRKMIVRMAKDKFAFDLFCLLYRNCNVVSSLSELSKERCALFLENLIDTYLTKIKVFLISNLLKHLRFLQEDITQASYGVKLNEQQVQKLICMVVECLCEETLLDAIYTDQEAYDDACNQDEEEEEDDIEEFYHEAMYKTLGYAAHLENISPKVITSELKKLVKDLEPELSLERLTMLYFNLNISSCHEALFDKLLVLGSTRYLPFENANKESSDGNTKSNHELTAKSNAHSDLTDLDLNFIERDLILSIIIKVESDFTSNSISKSDPNNIVVLLTFIGSLCELKIKTLALELLEFKLSQLQALNKTLILLSKLYQGHTQSSHTSARSKLATSSIYADNQLNHEEKRLLRDCSSMQLSKLAKVMTTSKLISWCLSINHIKSSINQERVPPESIAIIENMEQNLLDLLGKREDFIPYLNYFQSERYLNKPKS